jgi:hypothetical protein
MSLAVSGEEGNAQCRGIWQPDQLRVHGYAKDKAGCTTERGFTTAHWLVDHSLEENIERCLIDRLIWGEDKLDPGL